MTKSGTLNTLSSRPHLLVRNIQDLTSPSSLWKTVSVCLHLEMVLVNGSILVASTDWSGRVSQHLGGWLGGISFSGHRMVSLTIGTQPTAKIGS